MKPSELLRESKNQFFERGWGHGDLLRPDGSVCALGAVCLASGMTEAEIRAQGYGLIEDATGSLKTAVELLDAVIPEHGVYRRQAYERVYNANDRTEKLDTVLEWFDKAEKLAEQRERA